MKIQIIFIIMVVSLFSLTGCQILPGNNEISTSGPITILGSGTNIYTIISAQPASKPESDYPPYAAYPFDLSTVMGSYITPSLAPDYPAAISRSAAPVSIQAEVDTLMREMENRVLSEKSPQLSKSIGALRAPPVSIGVGTAWNNVFVLNTNRVFVLINTTCRYVSNNSYIFVDNRDTSAMSTYLGGYAAAFEAIYITNRLRFGTENDVDLNNHVIIVFSRELTGGLLGYFNPADKYLRDNGSYTNSNEGDIFYMTTDAFYQGNVVLGTLAHEFQHMIYFDEHYNRDVETTFAWLNEALSQAAEYYNGYTDNHLAWIQNFLRYDTLRSWPNLSLTYWTQYNYGYGALFIRYLIDQFGDTAIKNMCSTNLVGIAAVEAATREDFNTIFNNFTRAIVISGTGEITDSKYNFSTLDIRSVQPAGRKGLITDIIKTAGSTLSSSLYPYAINFAVWTGGTITNMTLSGANIVGTGFQLDN